MPPVQPLRWVFLDADAFFASCELAARGLARDTPLAVGSAGARGSVIACSYAARAEGVARGQWMADARRACPRLVCVPQRPPPYAKMHERMVSALEEHAPVAHVGSVDEGALRLAPRDQPMRLLHTLGAAVPAALGEPVQVSLGAAPSMLLAKLAAESGKPAGRTVLYGTDEELARFPPEDLAGVGPMLAARLAANGIGDLARLRALGPSSMRALWRSRLGRDLWMELAGYDVPPARTERRSVSHARVLAGTEKGDARAVFRGLVVLAAHRLRRMDRAARVLEGRADGTAFRVKVSPPSASEQALLRIAALAWDRRVPPGPKDKVGVFLHVARDAPSRRFQASLAGEPSLSPDRTPGRLA